MWKNAFNFQGRSRRKEYWMPVLFNVLIGGLLMLLMAVTELQIFFVLYCIYTVVIIIPAMSLAVRRLHDVGKSGWYYLIALIPFGAFYLLYLFVQDSEAKTNQWGGDPKKNER